MTKSEFKIVLKAILRDMDGNRSVNSFGNAVINEMVPIAITFNSESSKKTFLQLDNFLVFLSAFDKPLAERLYEEEAILDSFYSKEYCNDYASKDEWVN